jgi:hypothetical protein
VNAVNAPASISHAVCDDEGRETAAGVLIAAQRAGLPRPGATANSAAESCAAEIPKEIAMTRFYRPPLVGIEEDPFARDGEDTLIRRGYWLGLSDRSLVMLMTQGIGARLTPEEKRVHLEDIRRAHLIDQVLAPEILPPQRR